MPVQCSVLKDRDSLRWQKVSSNSQDLDFILSMDYLRADKYHRKIMVKGCYSSWVDSSMSVSAEAERGVMAHLKGNGYDNKAEVASCLTSMGL